MSAPTAYRRGTTVVVVAGDHTGTIGKVTGQTAANVYIEQRVGPNRVLVVAPYEDVMVAPHPLSWYARRVAR